VIQQVLIVGLGSLAASTPYIAGILFFIIFAWIFAARNLNKRFNALNAQKEAERAAAEASAPVVATASANVTAQVGN
jgi:ATP/ADP translocase